MTTTGYPHIERDEDGIPRVRGNGLKVLLLIGDHVYRGDTAEQLVHAHPPLTLGQAHMVLAYYYDYKDMVDAELAARERRAEELRAEIEERQGPDRLREKLRAIQAEVDRRLA